MFELSRKFVGGVAFGFAIFGQVYSSLGLFSNDIFALSIGLASLSEMSDGPPGERERDRETERQRDRETERQRDRETARQRDRKTERQRDRETERQIDR